MAVQTTITILHDKETAQDVIQMLKTYSNTKIKMINQVELVLAGLVSGIRHGTVDLQIPTDTAVYASQTITPGTVVATNTVTINGIVFTAVASGPTANQFLAGSAAVSGIDLARSINTSVSSAILGVVRSEVSAAGVVNVIAQYPGALGNLVTTATSANLTAGGATLVGGTYTANLFKYGL